MIFDISVVFIVFFCSVTLFAFVGNFLSVSGFNDNLESGIQKFFISSLIGSIACVGLYAIISTQFQTIFLIAFIILGFLWLRQGYIPKVRNEHLYLKKFDWKLIFSLSLMFVLTLSLDLFFSAADNLETDLLFYAKISEYLHVSGENKFHGFHLENSKFEGIVPYHYFEFWYVNCFQRFTSLTAPIVLRFVAYPLFKSYVALGIMSLVHKGSNKGGRLVIAGLLTSLILLVPIEPVLNTLNSGWGGHGNVWQRPNLIFYALFSLPVLIFIRHRSWLLAVIFSLFIPLISITTAPSYFVGVGLVLLYLGIVKKHRIWFQFLSMPILTAAGILAIYFLFGCEFKLFEHPPWIELMQSQFAIIKAIIGTAFWLLSQVIIVCVGLFILCVVTDNRKWLNAVLLAGVFTMAGVVLFQLTPLIDNTYQFPYFGYALLNLVLCLIILEILLNGKVAQRLFMLLFSLFIVSNKAEFHTDWNTLVKAEELADIPLYRLGYNYESLSYLDGLKNEISKIGFTLDEDALRTVFPGKRRHFLTMQLGAELSYKLKGLQFYPLVPSQFLYDFPKDSELYAKALGFNSALPFYNRNIETSDDVNQFIDENEIHFLIRPNLIEGEVEPIIDSENEVLRLSEQRFLIDLRK